MANLRTMGYLGGAVECGMMNAAIHQLSHHIKVPNYNSSGLSDSKIPDAQAGWEKALTTAPRRHGRLQLRPPRCRDARIHAGGGL